MTTPTDRHTTAIKKPRIGITMGDAAGIGAEITLKALSDGDVRKDCHPLIIGDLDYLRRSAKMFGLTLDLRRAADADPDDPQQLAVYDLQNIGEEVVFGTESALTGKASAEYITTAVKLWRAGEIDAVATAPISKRAIHLGGYPYPGHTEYLAELTETPEFAMSFFAGDLRVVLLSTHVSLLDAIALVTTENLVRLIKFTDAALGRLLKKKVKIAVAGVNPHASEGGMFGSEEAAQIAPAIDECRERYGIDVSGAYSPDTIFLRAFRGEFDAVIACYHDQATIAVKCLSFGASVNVTLGLPLIRTSVDHGTAFDIAGKNSADASSMKAAINLAAQLVRNS